MILPGKEPTYVLLCPLISASSEIPPNEHLKNFLPKARAMLLPKEVLPVHGGPKKHKIGLFKLPVNFLTARYSMILFLGFSKP